MDYDSAFVRHLDIIINCTCIRFYITSVRVVIAIQIESDISYKIVFIELPFDSTTEYTKMFACRNLLCSLGG